MEPSDRVSCVRAPRKILIVGGSGFVSGALAVESIAAGNRTWVVNRGQRPPPAGVELLVADRNHSEAFSRVIESADTSWDAVIDCIAFESDHAAQDVKVFSGRCVHLILVSSDSVYDPKRREVPQSVNTLAYSKNGYGGRKRDCEETLIRLASGSLQWTIVRPTHVYGPGAHLGCTPTAFRDPLLPQHIREGRPLSLVDGGRKHIQPIHVRDLAQLLLSLVLRSQAYGCTFNAAGPETMTARAYYETLARLLDCSLQVDELSAEAYQACHPEHASTNCDRVYDLSPLSRVGAHLPHTPFAARLADVLACGFVAPETASARRADAR